MGNEESKGLEGLSRQARYKVIRFKRGDCVNCGDPRGESPYLRVCVACGEGDKKSKRKKHGRKAWKPGSPGRPPLSSRKQPSPKSASQNDTEALPNESTK